MPSPAEQVAADVAARIEQADNEAFDARAAFTAGRFEEYWKAKAAQVLKRVEDAGERAIANAKRGNSGESS